MNLSGGNRVVAIYAELLADRGHQVNILYPKLPRATKPSITDKLKNVFNSIVCDKKKKDDSTFFEHGKASMLSVDFYDSLNDKLVPDADVIIATFWLTAKWIRDLSLSKGKKVYLIQHYEVHPWLPINEVKKTYRLPYKKIAVSEWIADSLDKHENCAVDAIVLNGVDQKQFYAPTRTKNKHFTVGFMYSERAFKGSSIAIEAIEIVRKVYPSLKVVVFSSKKPSLDMPLPLGAQFYLCPDQSYIREIYASCDAWLFTSINEGFGLPILEALACRTPVIATPAGAATSIVNSSNGSIVDDFSSCLLAKEIEKLIEISNEKWMKISNNALLTAEKYSWINSVIEFEKELNN